MIKETDEQQQNMFVSGMSTRPQTLEENPLALFLMIPVMN